MDYRVIYSTLVIIYFWYRALLLIIAEFRREKEYPAYKHKVTIIVPVYNEKEYLIKGLIESLLQATKNLDAEIIFGDDGSHIPVSTIVNKLDKNKLEKIKVFTFPHRGKRATQKDCILKSTGRAIITLDSDILLEKHSIEELIKPLNDPKVGAVTGQVRILNEDENLLTKATGTLYWNSFNVTRKSLSAFGIVNICSGALSAYKREIVESLLNEYLNQKFLGKKCVHGEDRALTNMILKKGYQVKYVQKSVVYTTSPSKLKDFVKQQYRWRQSAVREGLICMSFSWRTNPLLFIETFFILALPFLGVAVLLSIILLLIEYPYFITSFIIGIIIITIIHDMFLLIYDVRKLPYALLYTFLTYVLLIWLWPIALINVRSTKWGTR
jgi:hyaluronan synthase